MYQFCSLIIIRSTSIKMPPTSAVIFVTIVQCLFLEIVYWMFMAMPDLFPHFVNCDFNQFSIMCQMLVIDKDCSWDETGDDLHIAIFLNIIFVYVYFLFKLPICSCCNGCRDLDLCRDSALLDNVWCCSVPQCGQSYDREQMENSLLQIVRWREKLYHLQDLVCLRCRQVKAAHLAEQCVCGGSFRCKEDSFEFEENADVSEDSSQPEISAAPWLHIVDPRSEIMLV